MMMSQLALSRFSLNDAGLDNEFDLLLGAPVFVFLCFVYFGQTWLLLEPAHWCRSPELDALGFGPRQARRLSVPPDEHGGYDQCLIYDVNFTLLVSSGNWSGLGPGTPTTSCRHGWHFDFGTLYPTAVSEFGWVCENAWLKPFVSSMFFVGAVIGTMVFGYLADRFGRLPALVSANLLGCCAGLLTAAASGPASFALGRLLAGATYDQQCVLALVLLSESVGARYRTLVINVPMATSFMLAAVCLPWLASGLAHWRTLALVTGAPMAGAALYAYTVPESARWLLRRLAAENGRFVPDAVFAAFEERARRRAAQQRQSASVAELFRRPALRGRTLVLMFTTMAMMLSFDSSVRNTNFDIDMRVAASVLSLMELRATFSGALLMAALSSLMLGLTLHARTLPTVSTTFAMLNRLFATVAANICWQVGIELTPTQVRSQGCGLIHVAGHAVAFFSPYILHLHRQMRGLPQLLLSAFGLLQAQVRFADDSSDSLNVLEPSQRGAAGAAPGVGLPANLATR
ncbi:solute carrier family 22 member 1-like [Pollicipes pollicipes]|uniref:solute carrier family 22 member 1-like n=1 Tax=Pollicipes pollicipes TaxID=41117 RepID=UPI0018855463|nr:solute carrier family 22 member 1-like [Pollicipes pollicipes]